MSTCTVSSFSKLLLNLPKLLFFSSDSAIISSESFDIFGFLYGCVLFSLVPISSSSNKMIILCGLNLILLMCVKVRIASSSLFVFTLLRGTSIICLLSKSDIPITVAVFPVPGFP